MFHHLFKWWTVFRYSGHKGKSKGPEIMQSLVLLKEALNMGVIYPESGSKHTSEAHFEGLRQDVAHGIYFKNLL